jgi:hypothetical protein
VITPVILPEDTRSTPLGSLLGALGVMLEHRPLAHAFGLAGDMRPTDAALIVSEEQLAAAHALTGDPAHLINGLARYRHVLVYPFRGRPDGLRALSACTAGRAEAAPAGGGAAAAYSVTKKFSAAGPFAGLTVQPADTSRDSCLSIRESCYSIEPIISTPGGALFVRIALPSTELFVTASTAVFDVDVEVLRNLDVRECFSGLVPLLMFLRHSGVVFWRTPQPCANVIIDDLNLRPRYGFVDLQALARHVDDLRCAVSIAFIPWNCARTSRPVVELFRTRWPRLSLSVHGCDHVGAEFATASADTALPMLALSLARMNSLKAATGLPYDPVMVFPQGRFSAAAMAALRQTDFQAAVNTELVDHRAGHGVPARELLKPAITSYAGFPLFLRRRANEPLSNFALDLLLGKPCLVVTHHDDFREGLGWFASLVSGLSALDPSLHWTSLGAIVSGSYSARPGAASNVNIRLLGSPTTVERRDKAAYVSFSKAEPLADQDFDVLVAGQSVKADREGADLVFHSVLPAEPTTVEVTVSRRAVPPLPVHRLRYRTKVATRRYLSEIRDNYVAQSPSAVAAVRFIRGLR